MPKMFIVVMNDDSQYWTENYNRDERNLVSFSEKTKKGTKISHEVNGAFIKEIKGPYELKNEVEEKETDEKPVE